MLTKQIWIMSNFSTNGYTGQNVGRWQKESIVATINCFFSLSLGLNSPKENTKEKEIMCVHRHGEQEPYSKYFGI